jgi:carbohydrate diacid regulator
LDNNEILIETLQVYIENNLNVMETADNLNIHRNTLNYRLSRIYEITGKDPKKILDLIDLVHILIHRKM